LRAAAVASAILGLVVLVLGSLIGIECYGNGSQPSAPLPPEAQAIPGYTRPESYTYLSLPEWSIVYVADEYGRFVAGSPPSGFPYFRSIGQYWWQYREVCQVTRSDYPFDFGYHMMLGVIGLSFTVESALKGVYENTVGRLTELMGTRDTPEDALAVRTAQEYGAFMHTVPWYKFPFAGRVRELWTEVPLWGPHVVRKWERRLALTAEYGVKAVYGFVMALASRSAYGVEDQQIHVWIDDAPPDLFADTRVVRVQQVGPRAYIVKLPRYEAFTEIVRALHARGVTFVDIAGNDEILLTAIAPAAQIKEIPPARSIVVQPLLTDRSHSRMALRTPIRSLREVITRLGAEGATFEHLYDY
jgi:hypothetical protein